MKDFDRILGDSDKRYLSNGYRNVSHAVTLHRPLDCRDYQLRDVPDIHVSVDYPQHWSSKPGGRVDPHLSSFDAVVLGLGLTDLFCPGLRAMATQKARPELSRLMVRAGAKPVSVGADIAGSWSGGLASGVLNARGKFGNMTFEASFCNGPTALPAHVDQRDGVLAAGTYSVPRPECKFTSSVLNLDTITRRMVSRHVEHRESKSQAPLIYSRPECGVSYPDFLRLAAQAAQVLIYSVDGTERSATTNIWMRSATFYPLHRGASQSVEHWLCCRVAEARTVKLRDQVCRVFQVEFDLDGAIGCDASLAYVCDGY